MYIPDLVSTNQLTDTDFTLANGRLPGEARNIGHLPCDESKWIQWHQESVATRVGNAYSCHGGSSLEESARRYEKEPSGHKRQVAIGGQVYLPLPVATKEILLELTYLRMPTYWNKF